MFDINPSLGPLASCQQLRVLCDSVALYNGADFLPLAKCSLLAELTLRCCDQLSDVCALQKLSRLHKLGLVWCLALADVSPLSTCAMLQSLAIRYCPLVIAVSISELKAAKPDLCMSVLE